MHFTEYRAQAEEAAAFLADSGLTPTDVAILCGSGLSGLAAALLPEPLRLPLSAIPHLAPAGVAGHGREAVWSLVGGLGTLILTGRAHLYEGHGAARVGFVAAMARQAGARLLICTNAAGSLHEAWRRGDVMLHESFINHQGESALQHLDCDSPAQRFLDPNPPYDPALSSALERHLRAAGLTVHRGTYVATRGPQYETEAELRMMRGWGADAVGMSTVPEVIVSHLFGLPVVALSVVTNECFAPGGVTHQEVLDASASIAPVLGAALNTFLNDPAWQDPER